MKRHKGVTVQVFAPLIVDRKGFYTDLAKWALKKGFTELRVDGELCSTENWPRLDRFKEHSIDLPVGEMTVSAKTENQVHTLIQRGVDYGSGMVKIAATSTGKRKKPALETLFSTQRACPSCQTSFPELDPRMFSYNSKHGWCTGCYGTGVEMPAMSDDELHEGADIAAADLGDDEADRSCEWCEGQRLKPESLNVYFKDYNIADFTNLSISEAISHVKSLRLNERESSAFD